jgi:hypothetical protein
MVLLFSSEFPDLKVRGFLYAGESHKNRMREDIAYTGTAFSALKRYYSVITPFIFTS